MSALCQKQTHAVQRTTDKWSPRRCVGIVLILDPPHAVRQSALSEHFHQAPGRRYGTLSRPSTLRFWHPCHGDDVMDRNYRIVRRERFEILKIAQGLGEGVVETLAPEHDSRGARRKHRSWQSRRSYLAGLPRPVLDWAPGRWDRCKPGRRSAAIAKADAQGVTMTAGYRDFRPRDEDPNDHAAVAAVQARSEAVKADEAFRQAMLAAIAAGQECARTAVSPAAGAKVPKIIRGE